MATVLTVRGVPHRSRRGDVAFVACVTPLAVPGVSDVVPSGRCVTDVLIVSCLLATSFGFRVGRRVISIGVLGTAAH
jgi:hypothetical protein